MISGSLNGGMLGVAFALGALVALMFVGTVALVGTTAAVAATASLALMVSALVLAMTTWTVAILLTTILFNSPALTQDEKQCFTGGFSIAVSLAALRSIGGSSRFAEIIGWIITAGIATSTPLQCIFRVDIP